MEKVVYKYFGTTKPEVEEDIKNGNDDILENGKEDNVAGKIPPNLDTDDVEMESQGRKLSTSSLFILQTNGIYHTTITIYHTRKV